MSMQAISQIGFVGGGRVTRFMLRALVNKQALPAKVVVSDPDALSLEKTKTIAPEAIACRTDNQAVANSDLIFLAVHPPVLSQVAEDLSGSISEQTIVISLAPVVTMRNLSVLLGGSSRLVRMIPNAPAMMQQGYNPVAFHPAFPVQEKARLFDLFCHWGEAPEVDEHYLEAYAVLTGMGPTYFWFQWLTLLQLGREFGLAEDRLRQAIPAMLHGAVDTLFHAGLSDSDVLDLIPVYPLRKHEDAMRDMLCSTLGALFQKLTAKP
jgi:pyrroline-5-carboxylate reductase